MTHPVQRFFRFLLGALTDPITGALSGCRLAGFACLTAGIYVAVRHPAEGVTVGALISGGAVAFLSRVKSDSGL
jgi:cell shape-determining protein MreD